MKSFLFEIVHDVLVHLDTEELATMIGEFADEVVGDDHLLADEYSDFLAKRLMEIEVEERRVQAELDAMPLEELERRCGLGGGAR